MKQMSVERFPSDFFFVLRVLQILRWGTDPLEIKLNAQLCIRRGLSLKTSSCTESCNLRKQNGMLSIKHE